jgi:hypothetical protein
VNDRPDQLPVWTAGGEKQAKYPVENAVVPAAICCDFCRRKLRESLVSGAMLH